jgi:hypothetical protein
MTEYEYWHQHGSFYFSLSQRALQHIYTVPDVRDKKLEFEEPY